MRAKTPYARFSVGYKGFADFSVFTTINVRRGDTLTPCKETLLYRDLRIVKSRRPKTHQWEGCKGLVAVVQKSPPKETEDDQWHAVAKHAQVTWADENKF
jgi:hypothetical protein